MIVVEQQIDKVGGKVMFSEVKMKPAEMRSFALWLAKRTTVYKYPLVVSMLTMLPDMMIKYMQETGNSIKLEGLGIIKLLYRDGRVCLAIRNNGEVLKELNNHDYMIKYFYKDQGRKVYTGGRIGPLKADI